MWKIFFTYSDKSRCTVKGKGTITPELAMKCYYRYGLHAAESIYQQYPKKDHEPVPLKEKIQELEIEEEEIRKIRVASVDRMLKKRKEEDHDKGGVTYSRENPQENR